jgi:hypothetical protein
MDLLISKGNYFVKKIFANIIIFITFRFLSVFTWGLTPSPYYPTSLSFLRWESHLASVVTQENDNGCEEEHQDKIDWIRNFLIRASPDDKDDLKDKEKDGELNFSPHELSEFESIIDPPCEKAGSHCKGRRDGSQDEEVKTGDLERRGF